MGNTMQAVRVVPVGMDLRKIFELTGRKPIIDAISTSEYPTPAKRPLYSVLTIKSLEPDGYYMKEWRKP